MYCKSKVCILRSTTGAPSFIVFTNGNPTEIRRMGRYNGNSIRAAAGTCLTACIGTAWEQKSEDCCSCCRSMVFQPGHPRSWGRRRWTMLMPLPRQLPGRSSPGAGRWMALRQITSPPGMRPPPKWPGPRITPLIFWTAICTMLTTATAILLGNPRRRWRPMTKSGRICPVTIPWRVFPGRHSR